MKREDSFGNYRQSYRDGHKSNHTWGGRIEKLARHAPDGLALVQGDRRLTWAQLDKRANRMANALLDLGVRKEERVAIMGFNSIEWAESYFGISKHGAVPVNVNPRFLPNELKYILDDSDAVALIAEEDCVGRIAEAWTDTPLLRHVIIIGSGGDRDGMLSYERLMERSFEGKPLRPWDVRNDDFAYLFYTGGTTGYPKGTVWDGYNRVRGLDSILITGMGPLIRKIPDMSAAAITGMNGALPFPLPEKFLKSDFFRRLVNREQKSDFMQRFGMALQGSAPIYRSSKNKVKIVLAAQLFHGAAYEAGFSMIAAMGATNVFLESNHPFDPRELWETVERVGANFIIIVGDAYAIPMAEELERRHYDISSLFAICSSGVRWSPQVKKKLLAKHPGLILMDEYGSTETSAAYSQVSAAGDGDISQLKIKIVDRGINRTRVIDPDTGKDVKPGQRGELVFGGFNSLGYWKDHEKTQRCYRVINGERWFHVGDEGMVDEDGYFHFIGRGSSIINSGGEKVFAEEVEEILMQHPGVREVGVTGVPDDRWGEAVTAVIRPIDDADLVAGEIIDFCRGRMAGYKKPKHILFVDELPRAVSGKLERKALKKMAGKMLN